MSPAPKRPTDPAAPKAPASAPSTPASAPSTPASAPSTPASAQGRPPAPPPAASSSRPGSGSGYTAHGGYGHGRREPPSFLGLPRATCLEPGDEINRPDLPDMDATPRNARSIEACADCLYIASLESVLRAMRALVAGWMSGRFRVDCDVAVLLNDWVCESVYHVSAQERQTMAALMLDGTDAVLDPVWDAVVAVYEARAACCDDDVLPPAIPTTALRYAIETAQRELTRLGEGVAPFFALRAGGEVIAALNIVLKPDLACVLGAGHDADPFRNVDLLLGPTNPDGSPRRPAYQDAAVAVAYRKAIDGIGSLDITDTTPPTNADIDGLAANLALLRAAQGRRDFHKPPEALDDAGAQMGSDVLRMSMTSAFSG